MKFVISLLTLLFVFTSNTLDAKCDCQENELVYVCHNGRTKRVNCSATSEPGMKCGPCEAKEDCKKGKACDDGDPCTIWDTFDHNCDCVGIFADDDGDGICNAKENEKSPCSECPADGNGQITICWIPTVKSNFKTVKGECVYLGNFFDEKGKLKGKNQCGPCKCEMIGEKDTDGDGICDSKDGCPENPDRSEPGSCGCDDVDSDNDGVCDSEDECNGHDDNADSDNDGTADGCDLCPDNPNFDDEIGPCGCDDIDSDGDGICDDLDVCQGHDDNEDLDNDGTPDGCDLCPENPNYDSNVGPCGCDDMDSDNDGVCDSQDCDPSNPSLPSGINLSCNDGDPNTINDVIIAGTCECKGEPFVCPDGDSDGVCDGEDICQGHPDNQDNDGDGTPNGCDACPDNPNLNSDAGPCGCFDQDTDGDGLCDNQDCMPNNPQLPSNVDIACNDGNPNTINDIIPAGSCTCQGELTQCPDGDNDGVCDEDDICSGYPDNLDNDNDGTPNGCDECPNNPNRTVEGDCGCDECEEEPCDVCTPNDVKNDYEWIDKVSFNSYENETGVSSNGYRNYGSTGISLGHGDSLSIWVFPEYLEDICESSLHIYADWNGDCDFEDKDEILVWHRTIEEAGGFFAIPEHSKVGMVNFRIILHNGRIRSACQNYIDGEVEDYAISVFSRRNAEEQKKTITKSRSSINFGPNPVSKNGSLYFNNNAQEVSDIKLIDLKGNVVKTLNPQSGESHINVQGLNSGIYFIETRIENETMKSRILISED